MRRRDSDLGFRAERGNLSVRCEGRSPSGSPARARVPMRATGAEQLVVAMKFAKANGAKGLRHLDLVVGQPVEGRSQ